MGSVGTNINSSKNSPYGEFIRKYGDGTVEYEKSGVNSADVPGADEWFSLFDSVIKADAARQLGVSRHDIDYDENTGDITVWRDATPEQTRETGALAYKEFYSTQIIGNVTTQINSKGRARQAFHPKSYKFKLTGTKW